MRHLIDVLNLSTSEIEELCRVASDIIENPEKYREAAKGKILGSLFFEPSTRTRLSFESAMLSLGGRVLGFSDASNSSVSKGESVADTIRMVSAYTDVIAMRHPEEGAPIVASSVSLVPVINAGDGGHFHPTQTLTDLLTIKRINGRLNNLTVGICGDLKYGRTVYSLIAALSRYEGIKFVLISPDELKIPDYVKDEFLDDNFTETRNLEEVIPELDILYMTRVQGERFEDKAEYERLKDVYVLNAKKLSLAKKTLSVMHPLPRVNEIDTDVDADLRASYFEQARLGRYIRMALILKLLSENDGRKNALVGERHEKRVCKNKKCITRTERGILHLSENGRCIYCDSYV